MDNLGKNQIIPLVVFIFLLIGLGAFTLNAQWSGSTLNEITTKIEHHALIQAQKIEIRLPDGQTTPLVTADISLTTNGQEIILGGVPNDKNTRLALEHSFLALGKGGGLLTGPITSIKFDQFDDRNNLKRHIDGLGLASSITVSKTNAATVVGKDLSSTDPSNTTTAQTAASSVQSSPVERSPADIQKEKEDQLKEQLRTIEEAFLNTIVDDPANPANGFGQIPEKLENPWTLTKLSNNNIELAGVIVSETTQSILINDAKLLFNEPKNAMQLFLPLSSSETAQQPNKENSDWVRTAQLAIRASRLLNSGQFMIKNKTLMMTGEIGAQHRTRLEALMARVPPSFDVVSAVRAVDPKTIPPLPATLILKPVNLDCLAGIDDSQNMNENLQPCISNIPIKDQSNLTKDQNDLRTTIAIENQDYTNQLGLIRLSPILSNGRCIQMMNDLIAPPNIIHFSSSSITLKSESFTFLNLLAEGLRRCPSTSLFLGGHTDNIGPASANLAVSRSRALAVKQYLTSLDIQAQRLETYGFGEAAPITSNSSRESRAQNRRIEIRVKLE